MIKIYSHSKPFPVCQSPECRPQPRGVLWGPCSLCMRIRRDGIPEARVLRVELKMPLGTLLVRIVCLPAFLCRGQKTSTPPLLGIWILPKPSSTICYEYWIVLFHHYFLLLLQLIFYMYTNVIVRMFDSCLITKQKTHLCLYNSPENHQQKHEMCFLIS